MQPEPREPKEGAGDGEALVLVLYHTVHLGAWLMSMREIWNLTG